MFTLFHNLSAADFFDRISTFLFVKLRKMEKKSFSTSIQNPGCIALLTFFLLHHTFKGNHYFLFKNLK